MVMSSDQGQLLRTYMQEVERIHRQDVDTRKVAEGLGDAVVLVVHDEGTLSVDIAAIAHLALAPAQVLAVLGLGGIGQPAHLLQQINGCLGLS